MKSVFLHILALLYVMVLTHAVDQKLESHLRRRAQGNATGPGKPDDTDVPFAQTQPDRGPDGRYYNDNDDDEDDNDHWPYRPFNQGKPPKRPPPRGYGYFPGTWWWWSKRDRKYYFVPPRYHHYPYRPYNDYDGRPSRPDRPYDRPDRPYRPYSPNDDQD